MVLSIEELRLKAKTLRKNVLISVGVGKFGHYGACFSAAEIVTALYFYKMRIDPTNPKMPDRDRFILSKGHAGIIQYSALAERGYFPKSELEKTKTIGSMLQGHPDVSKVPGIEASTGSLGQGLSIGLGIALGLRMDKIDAKVYVLVGDGELAEGQIWEAAMAASKFKADNLVAILDKNNTQAQGRTADRFEIDKLNEKWEAFGWRVIEIDGHDMPDVVRGLNEADKSAGKSRPTMIIANTVKGKGLKAAEEHISGFHNWVLDEEQFNQALELFS